MGISLTNQDEYRLAARSIEDAILNLRRGISKAAKDELGRPAEPSERGNPGGYAAHARSALSELESTLQGFRLMMGAIDGVGDETT